MLRVKEICQEQGITLQELAGRLNIKYQSLYENINGNPSLNKLQAIAGALGVEGTELFAPPESTKITCPHCGRVITIKAVEK